MRAKVVSFINLKGGVGKTTLALTIGEFLAFAFSDSKKTLLLDIDAQSNLTASTISQQTMSSLQRGRKTVYHMMLDSLRGKNWNIGDAITKECSNIDGNKLLYILAAIPDLGQLDEIVLQKAERGVKIKADVRCILKRHIDKIRDQFEWILIDCPPNLSTLTSNAIIASDSFVVPVGPEFLSIQGFDLIRNRVTELKQRRCISCRTTDIRLRWGTANGTTCGKSTAKERGDATLMQEFLRKSGRMSRAIGMW